MNARTEKAIKAAKERIKNGEVDPSVSHKTNLKTGNVTFSVGDDKGIMVRFSFDSIVAKRGAKRKKKA